MAEAGLIEHLKPSGAPYLENRMQRAAMPWRDRNDVRETRVTCAND
jgi:hypothetical protein